MADHLEVPQPDLVALRESMRLSRIPLFARSGSPVVADFSDSDFATIDALREGQGAASVYPLDRHPFLQPPCGGRVFRVAAIGIPIDFAGAEPVAPAPLGDGPIQGHLLMADVPWSALPAVIRVDSRDRHPRPPSVWASPVSVRPAVRRFAADVVLIALAFALFYALAN